MAGQLYYYITSLPQLGELASVPPMTGGDMLERLAGAGKARLAVEAAFLSDDLLQRESLLAGEVREADTAVLTLPQVRNDEPLPEYLAAEEAPATRRVAADLVWERYFRYAARTAAATANALLAAWVARELALRNAVAEHRARALDLAPEDYFVAGDLADEREDFRQVLSEWASAPNPLAGLQVLDRARWAWITQRDRWYSFEADELVAYAAKLMLLARWHRMAGAGARGSTARRAG